MPQNKSETATWHSPESTNRIEIKEFIPPGEQDFDQDLEGFAGLQDEMQIQMQQQNQSNSLIPKSRLCPSFLDCRVNANSNAGLNAKFKYRFMGSILVLLLFEWLEFFFWRPVLGINWKYGF